MDKKNLISLKHEGLVQALKSKDKDTVLRIFKELGILRAILNDTGTAALVEWIAPENSKMEPQSESEDSVSKKLKMDAESPGSPHSDFEITEEQESAIQEVEKQMEAEAEEEERREEAQLKTPEFKGDADEYLPYNTNFEEAMKSKTFFADKSHLIRTVEKSKNVIFCRPRRFGKSLVKQMLTTYYDVKTNDAKFQELFGSLWIGQQDEEGKYVNRTALQGKYYILDIDFALLAPPQEDTTSSEYAASFNKFLIKRVFRCAQKYGLQLDSSPEKPGDAIEELITAAGTTPIFAFLDEYDRPFTSVLLTDLNLEDKEKLIKGLSTPYRGFWDAIKALNLRLYMTGITDFHIPGFTGVTFARNTFDPAWHTLSGYTEDDVKLLLLQIRALLPKDNNLRDLFRRSLVLPRLKEAYNGYLFAVADKGQQTMYNADMVNYYIRFTLAQGRYPNSNELTSGATSISSNILQFAASLPTHANLVLIPPTGQVGDAGKLSDSLDMSQIITVYKDPTTDSTNMFWKLLYHHGALTTKSVAQDGKSVKLGVPNQAAQREYLDRLRQATDQNKREFQEAKAAFKLFLEKNEASPLAESLTKHHFQITDKKPGGSHVRDFEDSFRDVLFACFSLVSGQVAELKSEVPLSPNKKGFGPNAFQSYADLWILPTDESLPGIIIEAKNISLAKLFPGDEDFDKKATKDQIILGMGEKDLLGLKLVIASAREGWDQAVSYLEKARRKYKRDSGYRAWVFVRVGLSRVLTFNVGSNEDETKLGITTEKRK